MTSCRKDQARGAGNEVVFRRTGIRAFDDELDAWRSRLYRQLIGKLEECEQRFDGVKTG
jgi:hypothetical protein